MPNVGVLDLTGEGDGLFMGGKLRRVLDAHIIEPSRQLLKKPHAVRPLLDFKFGRDGIRIGRFSAASAACHTVVDKPLAEASSVDGAGKARIVPVADKNRKRQRTQHALAGALPAGLFVENLYELARKWQIGTFKPQFGCQLVAQLDLFGRDIGGLTLHRLDFAAQLGKVFLPAGICGMRFVAPHLLLGNRGCQCVALVFERVYQSLKTLGIGRKCFLQSFEFVFKPPALPFDPGKLGRDRFFLHFEPFDHVAAAAVMLRPKIFESRKRFFLFVLDGGAPPGGCLGLLLGLGKACGEKARKAQIFPKLGSFGQPGDLPHLLGRFPALFMRRLGLFEHGHLRAGLFDDFVGLIELAELFDKRACDLERLGHLEHELAEKRVDVAHVLGRLRFVQQLQHLLIGQAEIRRKAVEIKTETLKNAAFGIALADELHVEIGRRKISDVGHFKRTGHNGVVAHHGLLFARDTLHITDEKQRHRPIKVASERGGHRRPGRPRAQKARSGPPVAVLLAAPGAADVAHKGAVRSLFAGAGRSVEVDASGRQQHAHRVKQRGLARARTAHEKMPFGGKIHRVDTAESAPVGELDAAQVKLLGILEEIVGRRLHQSVSSGVSLSSTRLEARLACSTYSA